MEILIGQNPYTGVMMIAVFKFDFVARVFQHDEIFGFQVFKANSAQILLHTEGYKLMGDALLILF